MSLLALRKIETLAKIARYVKSRILPNHIMAEIPDESIKIDSIRSYYKEINGYIPRGQCPSPKSFVDCKVAEKHATLFINYYANLVSEGMHVDLDKLIISYEKYLYSINSVKYFESSTMDINQCYMLIKELENDHEMLSECDKCKIYYRSNSSYGCVVCERN